MEVIHREYKKNKAHELICADCHRNTVVNNEIEGTAVCTSCGSVKEYNVIDETSEWRNFGNDGSGKSEGGRSSGDRTGSAWNTNLDSYGLDASITGGDSGDKMNKIARRHQTAHDKNVKMAMGTLRHYSQMLNLSKKVQEMVKNLYSNADKQGKLKGKSLDAKLAAMIYMASKIANCPKNLREIINVSQCKRRDVTK